jgi:hypothetical protein
VKKALSPEEMLTINRTRKFARKAREYNLTYFFLISMLQQQTDLTPGLTPGLDVISGFQLFRRAAGIGIGIPSMAGTPGGLRVRRYSVRNVLLV